MGCYIDLHIHSKHSSDGLLTPTEIVIKAKELNFRTIAIADHDTISGVEEALKSGAYYGIEVIPAIEITTEYNKHFYHVLAYYFDFGNEIFNSLIEDLVVKRRDRNLFRIKKINEIGLSVPEDIIDEINKGELIVGPTISKAVVEDYRNQAHDLICQLKKQDPKEAYILFYKKFIKVIDKEFAMQRWISVLDAIKKVRMSGSIPVLAHPGAELFYADEEAIKMLKENGLLGIEVYSTYHTPEQINMYKEVAEKLGLLITGGSDFHGKVKPHIQFGAMKIEDYSIVDALKRTKKAFSK